MKAHLFLWISLSLATTYYCDRILVFLPFPNWSHQMQYDKVWVHLAERGHQVDMYSAYRPKMNATNLNHVDIQLPKIMKVLKNFNPASLEAMGNFSSVFGIISLWSFGIEGLEEAFETSTFKTLMASNNKYDLVITEAFFAMESLVALGHRFNAPTIAVSCIGISDNSMEFFGNPNFPSFIPDHRLKYTDNMNFFQRMNNFYFIIATKLLEQLYYYPKQQAVVNKYFGRHYPSLKDMLRNMSLVLLYTNQASYIPVPLVPNMIPVGGIHLEKPGKLPQELQELADAASDGFIYVSFGSLMDPARLKLIQKQKFVDFFKKINLPVFWKINVNLNDDPIINNRTLSPNVIIKKWYPQNDMLAHPNIKLFITHGGVSSVMEATSIGVPMLGLPFFGDQYYNVELVKQRGYGLVDDWYTIKEESFVQKVNTILTDPRFKENALKWSRITNDHLVSPRDTAVYWIEYVLRHKGAHHLSAASRHLWWYQLYCLDLMVFVFTVILSVYFLIVTIRSYFGMHGKTNVSLSKKIN